LCFVWNECFVTIVSLLIAGRKCFEERCLVIWLRYMKTR
jgi:hypothetical protein